MKRLKLLSKKQKRQKRYKHRPSRTRYIVRRGKY